MYRGAYYDLMYINVYIWLCVYSAPCAPYPLCAGQLEGCPDPALEPQAPSCTGQGLYPQLQAGVRKLGGGMILLHI